MVSFQTYLLSFFIFVGPSFVQIVKLSVHQLLIVELSGCAEILMIVGFFPPIVRISARFDNPVFGFSTTGADPDCVGFSTGWVFDDGKLGFDDVEFSIDHLIHHQALLL